MREKLLPWIPAIFCAALSVITIITKLSLAFTIGMPANPADFVFYVFSPMCFFIVGELQSALRKENLALRAKIDELSSEFPAKTIPT